MGAKPTYEEMEGRVKELEQELIECKQVLQALKNKKLADQLKSERIFIERMINALVDTVFVFDPNTGKALRWNKAFTEISGFTDEEITTKKAPDEWYNEKDLLKTREENEKV